MHKNTFSPMGKKGEREGEMDRKTEDQEEAVTSTKCKSIIYISHKCAIFQCKIFQIGFKWPRSEHTGIY
jgi:hypothetical protein